MCFAATALAQVIPAPTIDCASTNENSGDVTINWTAPPLNPCGSFNSYIIYGATNINGPYSVVANISSQSTNSFDHIGANANNTTWYYYMEMVQNCVGSTSAQSDTVMEETLATPSIDYVTVAPGGVDIYWLPGASSQTAGYIVYYDLGMLATEIDTIYGINNNFYFDGSADPNSGSVSYTIAAVDACGNRTLYNTSEHNTIYLTANVNACDLAVELSWNLYKNWSGSTTYQIETTVDGGTPSIDQTLPSGSTGYNYSVANVTGSNICFTIRAVHAGGSPVSESNQVCLPLELIRSTTFNYIRNATVNPGGGVDLQWYIDDNADINAYRIERSTDATAFATIDSIPVSSPVLLNNYTDATAMTSQTSYYYEVVSMDDCGQELPSTRVRTIHLIGNTVTGSSNYLQWNAFELEHATVLNYTVYRIVNEQSVQLVTLEPNILEYTDRVSNEVSEEGRFCYLVEANYLLDLPDINVGESLVSRSNEICLDQPPTVYVPNAFAPDGVNKRFKPTLLYTGISDYEFRIFDRWGKELFATDLLNAGWDGTNNGEPLPLGGYAYYIRVVSRTGLEEEIRGMVILVR